MKQRDRKTLLPWWGYIVLNVVVVGFFYGVYAASNRYAEANNQISAGLAPVLIVCYLAFLAVSILDAAYDRFRATERRPELPPSDGISQTGSRETARKVD